MNFVKHIAKSWMASCALFRPSVLKTIVLQTCLTVLGIYSNLFFASWWLIPAYILLSLFSKLAAFAFLSVIIVYSSRYIVKDKMENHFWMFTAFLLVYTATIALMVLLASHVRPLLVKIATWAFQFFMPIDFVVLLKVISLMQAEIIAVVFFFFLIDSSLSLRSFFVAGFQALRLVFLNYPAYIILSFLLLMWHILALLLGALSFYFIEGLLGMVIRVVFTGFSWQLDLLVVTILLVFLPLSSALLHTIYNKQLNRI